MKTTGAPCFVNEGNLDRPKLEMAYYPTPHPCADSETAEWFNRRRVMLLHFVGSTPEIIIAPAGVLSAGWVIGYATVEE